MLDFLKYISSLYRRLVNKDVILWLLCLLFHSRTIFPFVSFFISKIWISWTYANMLICSLFSCNVWQDAFQWNVKLRCYIPAIRKNSRIVRNTWWWIFQSGTLEWEIYFKLKDYLIKPELLRSKETQLRTKINSSVFLKICIICFF